MNNDQRRVLQQLFQQAAAVFVQCRTQAFVEPNCRAGSTSAQLLPGQNQEGLRFLELIGLEGVGFFFSSGWASCRRVISSVISA